MTAGALHPISLLIWTIVLFVPIYFALIGGLYLARRHLPEARAVVDSPMETLLFFPAALCALVLALVIGTH
ncbi:MAG TPA: hypothetical protein VFD70_05240 [Anaerolineae bacterium]|nr:hypothetical protein [Anaerolineae bacterium]